MAQSILCEMQMLSCNHHKHCLITILIWMSYQLCARWYISQETTLRCHIIIQQRHRQRLAFQLQLVQSRSGWHTVRVITPLLLFPEAALTVPARTFTATSNQQSYNDVLAVLPKERDQVPESSVWLSQLKSPSEYKLQIPIPIHYSCSEGTWYTRSEENMPWCLW